ncbi:gliding motility-associated C-terminal domain-containing protein [Aureivirga sp. CE67]|uniref:T9SS type B sorting domain-containing protein n=1 Tax=Aureivirga sp. CE67 TaxID=1788983 RepID=UPI0018CBBA8C|nr:gliding motility-associated C-terminal domain-containing protein [Aureivirga sp. CE67]
MKKILLILLVLIPFLSSAQKESSIWFFGENAGLDFNTDPPTPITGSLSTLEGCTSISTPEGELLFYSDGTDVWNKNHESMFPPGTSFADKLGGNSSSTSSGIIIPYPTDENKYYIFTVDTHDAYFETQSFGLKYSTVDMTLNGGLGGVVEEGKNTELLPKTSEKISATRTADGNGFWLITHFEDKFYAYKITENGVDENPVITTTGPFIEMLEGFYNVSVTNMRGYLKFNLQGDKIGVAFYSNNKTETFLDENYNYPHPKNLHSTKEKGLLYLFDFDNETGIVSNPISLLDEDDLGSPYGVEFSPSGEFLYAQIDYYEVNYFPTESEYQTNCTTGVVAQFKTTAADIPASKIIIYEESFEENGIWDDLSRGSLQIAIDGKIYHTTIYEQHLSYIEFPNEEGLASNYVFDGVELEGDVSTQWGLPVFIQAKFEPLIFAENLCLGEETNFYIDNENINSVSWNFGDPDSGANNISIETSPSHIFTAVGTYIVTAEISIGIENFTVTKVITILDTPNLEDLPDFQLCKLLNEDTIFDFSEVSIIISESNQDVTIIKYYNSLEDLENDENEIENISSYETTQNETIYVYVENSSLCNAIGNFELIIIDEEFAPILEDLGACQLYNDIAEFDILSVYQNIIDSFEEEVTVTFYTSNDDMWNDENPMTITENYINVSNPETIYIKIIKEETGCFDTTTLTLFIHPEIENPELENLENCETSFEKSEFDLVSIENNILESLEGNYTINFYKNDEDLVNDTNSIEKSELYENSENPEKILIKITNNDTGCSVRNEIELLAIECVIPDIEVPNSFDPNSSGELDIDDLANYYPDFKMYIYNRYGTMVYEGNKNTENWDGTAKSSDKILPSGTYYYVLELNRNNLEPKTGWIFLSK